MRIDDILSFSILNFDHMKKLALIVLDGWGLGKPKPNNAIHVAHTPFFDHIWNQFPHTKLQASGEAVGLPQGQIGGSEVGHLTMGAGRVILQLLQRINLSFSHPESEKGILRNKVFLQLIALARRQQIHLIGLVSPGGVHSHEDHLFQLLGLLKRYSCISPYIHFISDGRDMPQKSRQYTFRRFGEFSFLSSASQRGKL